jgi:hypothetical protein
MFAALPPAGKSLGYARSASIGSGELPTEVLPVDPKGGIDQTDQNRHLDQRANHGREGRAMVDAKGRDGDGIGQFEIV